MRTSFHCYSLAGPANRQARVAADNVLGRNNVCRGIQSTAIVQVRLTSFRFSCDHVFIIIFQAFNITAATTGASEKALIAAKQAYKKIYVDPPNHVRYSSYLTHDLLDRIMAT